jgi:hypothetical protein
MFSSTSVLPRATPHQSSSNLNFGTKVFQGAVRKQSMLNVVGKVLDEKEEAEKQEMLAKQNQSFGADHYRLS